MIFGDLIQDVSVAELSAPQLACPLCGQRGGLDFDFVRREFWNAVFRFRFRELHAHAGCRACQSAIAPQLWTDEMHAFFRDNKANYPYRFSAGLTTPILILIGAFVLLLAVGAGYSQWERRYGAAHALSADTIRHALDHPTRGSILMVQVDQVGDGGPPGYTLLLVDQVNADGSIVARLHKRGAPGGRSQYEVVIDGEADGDFAPAPVMLRRSLNKYEPGYDQYHAGDGPPTLALHQRPQLRVVRVNKEG